MKRDCLLIVFHTITALQFSFSVYYGFFELSVPVNVSKMFSGFGGKWKFLTFWGAIIQMLFYFLCMLNDWFGTNAINPKKPPLIRKMKDFLFASVAFPIAMFVSVTFWGLMSIDRELVFPKAIDPYFPWWLNHLMHTMVLVSILIELILSPRQYPRRFSGIVTVVLFDFVYIIWIHVIYYKSGAWVYPVLSAMSFPIRTIFLGSTVAFSVISYYLGEALDNFVWGKKCVAENDEPDY
ncbi:androgen-induced gene 1 protein isoform X3 [Augochlora pura]